MSQTHNSFSSSKGLLRFIDVKPNELKALFFAAAYFYLLLCAYYIIRPIRNEMLIQNGVSNIQWLLLFAAAVMLLITPIFGWLTNRFQVKQFLSYCTLFFALNLVVFFVVFRQSEAATQSVWVSRAFYIWVNVFNMFIVSLFWSLMNDVFTRSQAKRLFAFIAAGGTAGALTGPIITTLLVEKIGLAYLLLIAACVLSLTTISIHYLGSWLNPDKPQDTDAPLNHKQTSPSTLKGGVLDGIKLTWRSPYLRMIACFVILYAILSTFLSIQLAALIEQSFSDSAERTKLFSMADLATNVLTLLFQLTITSKLIRWLGYRNTLLLVPIGLTIGFVLIGFAPILFAMVALSIFNRAGKYAILNPTSEMLFSVVSREEKYKAKNFIDTAIVRSSNVLSSWLYAGVKSVGAGAAGFAIVGAVVGCAWCVTAYWLGENQVQKRNETE